jgi:hypothetical protein
MLKNAKMMKDDLSLSTYSQYVEDFKFWMKAAGDTHKPPEKEVVKIFVNGLKPEIYRDEIYSRACENLRGVINEAREELATYREVLEITDRMKKSDVKKSPVSTATMEGKKSEKPGKSTTGASNGVSSKAASVAKSNDAKDVECYHCHKKGHYANKCPDLKAKDTKGVFKVRKMDTGDDKTSEPVIRHIRIRYSDLGNEDGFLRFWVLILNLGDPVPSPVNEGFLSKIFVDTGASCNTIDRSYYETLRRQEIRMEYIPGPVGGLEVSLVGNHSLHVQGDKVRMQMDVGTNMGRRGSVQEFLILDEDSENLVIGVHWHQSLFGGNSTQMVRMVNIDTFGVQMWNPLDTAQDEAPEDSLMDTSTLEVFPEPSGEAWENCYLNPDFPQLDRLRNIVRTHGKVLF